MEKDEMLYTVAVELLMRILKATQQEMISKTNNAYRVYTTYTRKIKLPPEVFVKFSRRFVHDSILQESHHKELEFQRNRVQILKEIP